MGPLTSISPLTCVDACSPGWTRTSNLSVNSRMLCQLSYRGPYVCARPGAAGKKTLAYVPLEPPIRCRPARTQACEAGWTQTNDRLGGVL